VVAAKDLCKFYGSVPAVQNVSFTLEPRQVLGYLGPNGSGKSTTVKMLTGLLEPTYGEVTYDHQNIHKNLVAYRKVLGYVPKEPNLYPFLTGEEYLDMIGTLRAMPQPRKSTRIRSLLELFSLRPHRHVTIRRDTFSTVCDNRESNLSTGSCRLKLRFTSCRSREGALVL